MPNTILKSFYNQQYGISKWTRYDEIFRRLHTTHDEQYNQLLPTSPDLDTVYCDTPIFACKFAQKTGYKTILALANEDGKLAIHNIAQSKTDEERYGGRAHNNAIFDLAWMFDRMKLVTASGDHTSKLFDIGEGELREERVFTGHTRSVKTVAFRTDDPSTFASGGRDGNIILWDTRSDIYSFVGKSDKQITNSHIVSTPSPNKRTSTKQHQQQIKSVTGLVFQDDNTLISCGAGDGLIKIWDLRKTYQIYKKEPKPKQIIQYMGGTTKNGFSNLLISSNGQKLYANCLDNHIYCYNLNSYDSCPDIAYNGHQNNTFYVKASLSGDGEYLISGSSDDNAYIWNVKSGMPLARLHGHNAEVTCVAWCDLWNDVNVVTCSDDMTHRIWRVMDHSVDEDSLAVGGGRVEMLAQHLPPNNQKRINTGDFGHTTKKQRLNDEIINETDLKRKHEDNEDQGMPSKKGRYLFGSATPTVNLPNFVLDGVAPHVNLSPPKKKEIDWLSKLRVEQNLKRRMLESNDPGVDLKMARLDLTTKSSKSIQSPILKFFKITNYNKCDTNMKTIKLNNIDSNKSYI